MSDKTLVTQPPTGLQRWFFRAPIMLYRIGLGGLMGGRFLLINHIGRKSGKKRQAVVEVVAHDNASGVYYVASGWGHKSQWFQNLQANPDVTIQVGWKKIDVTAEVVTPETGADVLKQYRENHEFAARELSKRMGIDMADADTDTLKDIVSDKLPVVAFHPSNP